VILCDPRGYGFLAAETFRGASCLGSGTCEAGLTHYPPSFSKNEQIVSIPR